MNLVFTCGGTGGHINPALAVAKMFRERYPDTKILFIGSDGMEKDLVPREGFELVELKVSGFQRKFTPKGIWENVCTFFRVQKAVKQAQKILKDFEADCVIGTGGYASYPALKAGTKLDIPTVVHESNAVPGLATRLVAKKVSRILVSFDDCRENYADPSKVIVTGTPCREEFVYRTREDSRGRLFLDERPFVLSYWGSQGAREMNKMIADFMVLEAEHDGFQHTHATGSFGWKWMPDYLKELGLDISSHPNLELREYLYDMPTAMAAADLVICRGGAATMSEITVSGTPAIIVPSPNVTDNHQEKNARMLEKYGGAVVIREKDCTGQILHRVTQKLLADKEKLASMRQALQKMAVVDATERIVKTVVDLVKEQ